MDTVSFLRMLAGPGDVLEIRTKTSDQYGTNQSWIDYGKIEEFAKVHIPIHTQHKRHVWVGVCPRVERGSSVPKHGRVLWADLSSAVSDHDSMRAAIERSGLPEPTVVVWSGYGYHLYWQLDKFYGPEELRSRNRRIRDLLPADAVHDPSRVMRVPGTYNVKREEDWRLCEVIAHRPEFVYGIDDFPAYQGSGQLLIGGTRKVPLSQENRELFKSQWINGQRHHLCLGIAGYLRKNLGYSEGDAVAEISSICREAGDHEFPQSEIIKSVRDTYSKPLNLVSGSYYLLENVGIWPHQEAVSANRNVIEIIDFARGVPNQQFWIPGLIGPGLLTLWAAPPKQGKSFAVMQIGYALATGTDIWDFPVFGEHRVLYFQGELSSGVVAERAQSLFGEAILKRPDRFAMTGKPKRLINLVKTPEILHDMAENYDVVIVDPIGVFNGNDENSAVSVTSTLSVFDPLLESGKAVLIVHHTRKISHSEEGKPLSMSTIRGSNAWFARPDALALQYQWGENHSQVRFQFRAAPERPPLTLYRLPTGGFTHDKQAYLKTQRSFGLSLAEEGLVN